MLDIDAAIERMRALSKQIDQLDPVDSAKNVGLAASLAEEMAQVWDGIDQWLTKGGALPAGWALQRWPL